MLEAPGFVGSDAGEASVDSNGDSLVMGLRISVADDSTETASDMTDSDSACGF